MLLRLAPRFPPPRLGLSGAARFFAEEGFVDWEREEIDPPDSPRMERTVAGDWAWRGTIDVDCSDEECAEASDFVEGVKRTFCKSRAASSRGEERAEAEEVEWRLERRAVALGDDMMVN